MLFRFGLEAILGWVGCGGSRSLVFFFQAEDGIRDWSVTGVQTCALPISLGFNPALLLQPVKRRVERALIHLKHVFRNLADALRDGPAAHWPEGDALQDE